MTEELAVWREEGSLRRLHVEWSMQLVEVRMTRLYITVESRVSPYIPLDGGTTTALYRHEATTLTQLRYIAQGYCRLGSIH